MVYSLQNVIEEIKKKAEEDDGDINTMKICHSLLKNIRSRSVENYVAYRKVFFNYLPDSRYLIQS